MTFIIPFLFLMLCGECLGCQDTCLFCSASSQLCFQCKNGYWDHNGKCVRCPDKCQQCKDNNNCSECISNFWGTGNCDKECPDSCDESGCAMGTGQCYKCLPGFYGTSCQQSCSLCLDGLCNMSDGQCLNGCIYGYYEDEDIANQKCQKCSDNCHLCQSVANCTDCETGFYLLTYETPALQISICYPCLPVCEECHTSSNCTVCKPGTYGPLCQFNCNALHCHRCASSDGIEKCTECFTGYILNGTSCVPEKTCSENCVNGCIENDLCEGGCKEGWSGPKCVKHCVDQCQTCEQTNDTLCRKCKGAFFKSSCNNPCSINCSKHSVYETCRLEDGYCLNGCIDGNWGNECDKPCHIGCKSAQCNQKNGFCAACSRSFYGPACESTCSKYCFDDGKIPQICSKIDGRCELGCIRGSSGDRCVYITSASSMVTTLPTTESIVSEKSNLQPDKEDNSETKFFIFGIMAGVGICLLVAASTALVFFIRRRQKSKRNNALGNVDKTEYENTMFRMKEMPSEQQVKKGSLDTAADNSSEVNDDRPVEYEQLQVNRYDDRHQYSGMI